jgi:hypothetical protein
LVPELEHVEKDWRKLIADYLPDPSQKVDKGIRRIDCKFILINDELYHRTTEDLLLKCLDHDQAKIAMGEVHESICGTHQSAPKMKWLEKGQIAFGTTKGAKNVKFLVISKLLLQQRFIPSSNLDRSEVGA